MESKKWLWIVVACLLVATVYMIVVITGVNSLELGIPQKEPASKQDQPTLQTASLGGQSGMKPELKQPVVDPVEVDEEEQPVEPVETIVEDSPPAPEELLQVVDETIEEQDPPAPEIDDPVITAVEAPVEADVVPSNKGLVRGIVYNINSGSALIDDTIVKTGGLVNGVKIVRVHAGGVDFEKNGKRWTQKVSETPDSIWQ